MRKLFTITKEELFDLYIIKNYTVEDIAKQYLVGTASVNRKLKLYEIKKTEAQRKAAISKTKQNKTEEEKLEYSKHISEARKGKGLGQTPWNKGKTGLQVAWNKGLKMSQEFSERVLAGVANMTEAQKIDRKNKLSIALTGRTPSNKGQAMSDDQKEKLRHIWKSLSKAEQVEIIQKQYETKLANKTCNVSNPEAKYYNYLKSCYGEEDIIRQYKDDRYPFACDFYIKSQDLFIELNLHWSHGGHPFNEQNDAEKLSIWKEKAKTSEFYKNAIETWTVRDVEKLNIALKNKLNYKIYYKEEDLYE